MVASRSDAGDSLLGVWPGLRERADVRYVVRDWLAKLQIVAAGLAITTVAPIVFRAVPDGVKIVAVRGEPQEVRRLVLARRPAGWIPPSHASPTLCSAQLEGSMLDKVPRRKHASGSGSGAKHSSTSRRCGGDRSDGDVARRDAGRGGDPDRVLDAGGGAAGECGVAERGGARGRQGRARRGRFVDERRPSVLDDLMIQSPTLVRALVGMQAKRVNEPR